jgi:phage I-like protein
MDVASFEQPLPPARFQEFRIMPAGTFRTNDGSNRPAGIPGWVMNGTIALAIIAAIAARGCDVLIDYEHQSLAAEKNGRPAPAAGWFKRAEWREGDGLYALDVRWTAAALAMIKAREYRYISPVFSFDPISGEVTGLVSVGLVNYPALAGLTDLAKNRAGVSPSGLPRDTSRAIETFNQVFGPLGCYHHDTSPGELARLSAQRSCQAEALPASELDHLPPEEAAKLKAAFPGVWR